MIRKFEIYVGRILAFKIEINKNLEVNYKTDYMAQDYEDEDEVKEVIEQDKKRWYNDKDCNLGSLLEEYKFDSYTVTIFNA